VANPPLVLFMTPNKYVAAYAALMNKLSTEALADLGRRADDSELLGFVSPDAEYGSACLHLLNRSGIDPQRVLGLVLWGETGDDFGFESAYTDSYVFGSLVFPDSLTAFPTLCLPAMSTGWLQDADHWEVVKARYASLLQNGRRELKGGEPYRYITINKRAKWN
jgi:hypothetical protein